MPLFLGRSQAQKVIPSPPTASSPSFLSSSPHTDASPSPQAPARSDQPNAGQPLVNDQNGVFVFKKQVDEVVLHATAVDAQRHLLTKLNRGEFTVFEDGVAQSITSFREEDVPVAIGIVVDNSGSMRDKREKVNQAVLNLIRASDPRDEIFVVNFAEDYYLDQDFTSSFESLEAALQKAPMQGRTALYDAIVASCTHLENDAHAEKKILLVITDGQDNSSQETLQQTQSRLQHENGPVLYAIGLLGDDLHHDAGHEALASLASSTGGVAFFPASLNEVEDITRSIAHDIRSQYMIGYKSTNPGRNSGYHSIRVEARAQGYSNILVRTRSGYYAGSPPAN